MESQCLDTKGTKKEHSRNYDGVTSMRNKRNNRLILGITQDDIPMIGNQMNKHGQNLGWRPSDEKQKEKK